MAGIKERRRRQYGTGSVYQRASDGRWIGTAEAGYTRTGARRRVTVSASTEAQAKSRLKERIRKLKEGQNTDVDTRTTVKTWAETWLQRTQREVRPSTHSTDRAGINGWVIPTIGHRRLEQMTPADVRAVHDAQRAEGLSTTTANRYHGAMHRMLLAAVEEGHDIPQRVLNVRAPSVAANDREALPVPAAVAMLQVAAELPHASRWVAALLQGMRQGECLGLTWPAVDLDGDALSITWQLQRLPYVDVKRKALGFRVPDGHEARQLRGQIHLVRPKSKAAWRTIPLVGWMKNSLLTWRDICPQSPHGLVWPALDGEPANLLVDRDEWRAIQDTLGIRHPSGRHYTGHEARHTTATLLMELGVPESVRIAILGHSTIKVTRGYETADRAMALEALNRAAGRLGLEG